MTDGSPRTVLEHFMELLGDGAAPDRIAALFSEDVDFLVRGDAANAPWLGRRRGRAGVARFIEDLRSMTEPVSFELFCVFEQGDRALAYGSFETRVRRTGQTFASEFGYAVRVRRGLIDHYRVLEDGFAVHRAAVDPPVAAVPER